MILNISKEDSSQLRGLAILFIVFHNFFHLINDFNVENEFGFSYEHFANLTSNISLANATIYLFSFLGHYGVQIFIFLSGYGLAAAYGGKQINYFQFIGKRLLKLYPTFTIAIVLLVIYEYGILNNDFNTFSVFKDIFVRYTLISNWIPGKIFALSGPWWFYSVIVQLYLLFPLLIFLHEKYKRILWYILVLALAFTFLFNPYFSSLDLSLYYNFMGRLPVFVLGMIFALNKELNIRYSVMIVSLVVFVGGQMNYYLWYLSQLSFTLLIVPFALGLFRSFINSFILKYLILTGELSMYIFALNGFMRWPLLNWANNSNSLLKIYLYALIHIALVFIVAIVVRFLERKIMSSLFYKPV